MRLLTLIFGIVLLPKAHGLKCYDCVPETPGNCTAKQCPLPGQQCGALSLTSSAGGLTIADVKSKRCASTAECVEASVNFGISKILINNTCCNTDLCNDKPASVPIKSIPNGNKCFQCKGCDCTATLNCEGTEDYCISTKVNIGGDVFITMKGCVSKLLCLPETKNMPGVITTEMSCCQGNFCNSAGSTRAGLLLLVAPLVSLGVLS